MRPTEPRTAALTPSPAGSRLLVLAAVEVLSRSEGGREVVVRARGVRTTRSHTVRNGARRQGSARRKPDNPSNPRTSMAAVEDEAYESGRAWASGQLVFDAGQFESARSGFADYARDGEGARELRARVNRTILEDLEQKVLALRALHAKLRDLDAGENFGGVVARARPAAARSECGT